MGHATRDTPGSSDVRAEPTALFTRIIVTSGVNTRSVVTPPQHHYLVYSHLVWDFDGGGSDFGFFLPSLDGNEVFSGSEVLGFMAFLLAFF